MSVIWRLAAVFVLAAWAGGCGYGDVVHSWFNHSVGADPPGGTKLPGHVYLLRGLVGDIYSLGMDQLADKLVHHGVTATVHGMTEYVSVADDIIRDYKSGEDKGPIVLIGHSTGGDLIIAAAEKLKQANVPVALAFGFDPTRIADDVPSNVDVFINLYQRTNPIGGGRATPGPGFRGRLINVDLREHSEIVHINLDKTAAVQDAVVAKIVALATLASRPKAATKRSDLGSEIRPLVLKYTVPADAQIELWDSAIRVRAKGGDTIDAVASRYGVPGWAIAQINSLDQDHPLEVGQELIVPRSIYSEAALQEPVQPSPRKPPRPTTSVSSIRPAPSAREPAATTEPPPPPPAADTFSDRWRVPPTQ